MVVSQKLKIEVPLEVKIDTTIPLLGIQPEELREGFQGDISLCPCS